MRFQVGSGRSAWRAAALVGFVAWGSPAGAETPDGSATKTSGSESEIDVRALDPSRSTSLDGPRGGSLSGGVPLPMKSEGLVFNPRRRREARYATVEVVRALMRAAAEVKNAHPGGTLWVNDLSLKKGGPIAHHGSHQSGRDVDVLFYLRDENGKPLPSVGAPLDPRGRGVDFKDLAVPEDDVPVHLDALRTWRFLQALLSDPEAQVQRIFIAEHLRSLLLEEAERVDAPEVVRRRFALVTCQPGAPHDDHMHIRFFCTPQDIRAGCQDEPPMYPWHRKQLAEAGVNPVRAKYDPNRSARARKRVVSPAEARAKAGPMHEDVKRFLDRREAWLERPHPGRPWCR